MIFRNTFPEPQPDSAYIIMNPILDTRISVFHPPPSRSDYPPWILKQAGLESFGQRLISFIGKTERNAFFQTSADVPSQVDRYLASRSPPAETAATLLYD